MYCGCACAARIDTHQFLGRLTIRVVRSPAASMPQGHQARKHLLDGLFGLLADLPQRQVSGRLILAAANDSYPEGSGGDLVGQGSAGCARPNRQPPHPDNRVHTLHPFDSGNSAEPAVHLQPPANPLTARRAELRRGSEDPDRLDRPAFKVEYGDSHQGRCLPVKAGDLEDPFGGGATFPDDDVRRPTASCNTGTRSSSRTSAGL